MIFLSFMSSLMAAPENPYTFSVEAKLIPLFRSNPDFNSETNDSTWFTQQNIRLVAKGEWKGILVKGSFQDARLWGQESSPVTSSSLRTSLHEGYVQMGSQDNRSFYVRAGRQEYIMYDGMLMFHRGWNLFNIAFHGLRAHYEQKFASVDAAVFTLNGAQQFTTTCGLDDPDCTTEDINTMGDVMFVAHSDFNLTKQLHFQPYYLGMHQGPTESIPSRDRNIFSPGLRLAGDLTPSFSYVLDHTQQFGTDGDNEHRAWRAQATVNYKWNKYNLQLQYEERSGDGDSADDVANDFEPFFGAGHKFRGFGDYIGFANVRDWSGRIKAAPTPYSAFMIDYHYFQLNNPNGNWFTLGGSRGLGSGNDSTLGQEVDLTIILKPYKKTSVKIGHALFIPMGEGKTIAGEDWSSASYIWFHTKR